MTTLTTAITLLKSHHTSLQSKIEQLIICLLYQYPSILQQQHECGTDKYMLPDKLRT